jgi:hypothetical protein
MRVFGSHFKGTFMRNTLILMGIILALLGFGAWFYLTNMNEAVKNSIEKFGPNLMSVHVHVADVIITAQTGEGRIRDLNVANPAGFKAPSAFYLPDVTINLDIHTMSADTILIHDIKLLSPDVNVEQNTTGNNLRIIEAHIEGTLLDKADKKRFIVESFSTVNAKLHVSAPLVQPEVITIPLADIQLNGIGADVGGITASELLYIIFQELDKQIALAVTSRNLQNMIDIKAPAHQSGGIINQIRGFLNE